MPLDHCLKENSLNKTLHYRNSIKIILISNRKTYLFQWTKWSRWLSKVLSTRSRRFGWILHQWIPYKRLNTIEFLHGIRCPKSGSKLGWATVRPFQEPIGSMPAASSSFASILEKERKLKIFNSFQVFMFHSILNWVKFCPWPELSFKTH